MGSETRRWRVGLGAAGGGLIGLAVLLGLWVLLRGNDPFVVDTAWNTWIASWHAPVVTAFGHVMAWLGGGWFGVFAVPLGGAALFLVLRRPWWALFFLSAEVFSAALVQLLKHLFGRARPEDILIVSDYGSFPSGHTANAATLAVAMIVLFPRVWVAVVGGAWVLLMAFSRTVLHAHWLSDTLGGALLGAGAVLVTAAILWPRIRDERRTDAVREAPSLG